MPGPLRDAVRSLARAPAFTVAAALVLALALGAAGALFAAVNALLLRPLPYPDPQRLVAAFETLRPGRPARLPVSAPRWTELQARGDLFELAGALARGEEGLEAGDRTTPVRVVRATAAVQTLLGAQLALGEGFRSADEEPGAARVALLSHALWSQRFRADPALLGRTVALDGVPHTVVGVLAPGFAPHLEGDVWTPLSLTAEQRAPDRARQGMLLVLARLRPGLGHAEAQGVLQGEALRAREAEPEARGLTLVPLPELFGGELREALRVLLAAVALLLLIASTDVANLLLVRAAERQREFAIRLALGAGRGHLAARLLGEGVAVALLGAALGLLLAMWAIEAVAPYSTDLVRAARVDVDARVLSALLLAALCAGLASAAAPALQGTRPPLGESLKGALRVAGQIGRRRVRHALVVVQVALALVLLFAAGLSLRGLRGLLATDPGFDAASVLSVRLALPARSHPDGAAQARFLEALRARAAGLPGVDAAGFLSSPPLQGLSPWDFDVEGPQGRGRGHVIELLQIASPGAREALRVPLVRGRGFNADDRPGTPLVALVNAAMARRYWPGEDAVGKRIRPWRLHYEDAAGRRFWPQPPAPDPAETSGPDWFTVVGVIGDVRQARLQAEGRPEVWLPLAQFPVPVGALLVRSGSIPPGELRAGLLRAAAELDRNLAPGAVSPLADTVAGSAAAERDAVVFLSLFAALALLMAGLGVSGVVSSALAERQREIGIRLALGASAAGVARLLLGLGLRLALLGVALGWGLAWLSAGRLSALVARPLPFDPALCLAASALLVGAAGIASWVPARRASRVDPAIVLRHE